MTRSWASVVESASPAPKPKTVTPKNIITFTNPKFKWSNPIQLSRSPSSPMDKVNEEVEKINQKIISIDKAVEKAKAKAVEINLALSKKRAREYKDWTPVQTKKPKSKKDKIKKDKIKKDKTKKDKTKKDKSKKDKTTVFKVRKDNADMAMLSIIRSGIKDFKIEIIDE